MAKGLRGEVVQFSRDSNYTDGAKYQFRKGQVGVVVDTKGDRYPRPLLVAYFQEAQTKSQVNSGEKVLYVELVYLRYADIELVREVVPSSEFELEAEKIRLFYKESKEPRKLVR